LAIIHLRPVKTNRFAQSRATDSCTVDFKKSAGLFAVAGSSFLNLHDESESYIVMYHHILHLRFTSILAAFDEDRLDRFVSLYQHQFNPQ
jgi:hypothetical protein